MSDLLDRWEQSKTRDLLWTHILDPELRQLGTDELVQQLERLSAGKLSAEELRADLQTLTSVFTEAEVSDSWQNETFATVGDLKHNPSLAEPLWSCSYYDVPDFSKLDTKAGKAAMKALLTAMVKKFAPNLGPLDAAVVAGATTYVVEQFFEYIKSIDAQSYGLNICCPKYVVGGNPVWGCSVSYGAYPGEPPEQSKKIPAPR